MRLARGNGHVIRRAERLQQKGGAPSSHWVTIVNVLLRADGTSSPAWGCALLRLLSTPRGPGGAGRWRSHAVFAGRCGSPCEVLRWCPRNTSWGRARGVRRASPRRLAVTALPVYSVRCLHGLSLGSQWLLALEADVLVTVAEVVAT